MKTAQVDYHNISMGQGQDILAMSRLEVAHKQGHWVILNNIHLMPTWCVELEKKMDQFNQAGRHENVNQKRKSGTRMEHCSYRHSDFY